MLRLASVGILAVVAFSILSAYGSPGAFPSSRTPIETAPTNAALSTAAQILRTSEPLPPSHGRDEHERRGPASAASRPQPIQRDVSPEPLKAFGRQPLPQPTGIEHRDSGRLDLQTHDQDPYRAPRNPVAGATPFDPADSFGPPSGVIGPVIEEEDAPDASAVPAPPHSPSTPATHGIDGDPLIYLAFDSGSHPVWTPRVLDLLARYGAPATFFVVGARAQRYPHVVARITTEGHDVENQTLNHVRLDQVDAEEFRAQVSGGDLAIREALGSSDYRTSCLQPPYGSRDQLTVRRARSLGKALVTWDIDPQDWRRPGADRISQIVLAQARPGAIVLLNESSGGSQTLEALEVILRTLTTRGYKFALLCEHDSESPDVRSEIANSTIDRVVETDTPWIAGYQTDEWSGVIGPIEAQRDAIDASAIPAAPHSPAAPATHGTDGSPLIYLTFDDGPHAVWTPRVLDLLARYGAPATFFVVGFRTTDHPNLIVQIVEEGHEVENHTLHHHRLDELDAKQFRMQIEGADRAIRRALGSDEYSTSCLRPPFGATNRVVARLARELGKSLVIWDIDPQDWRRPGADYISQFVLTRARPGAVVLLHEGSGGSETLEALEGILSGLTARGYKFALLCE